MLLAVSPVPLPSNTTDGIAHLKPSGRAAEPASAAARNSEKKHEARLLQTTRALHVEEKKVGRPSTEEEPPEAHLEPSALFFRNGMIIYVDPEDGCHRLCMPAKFRGEIFTVEHAW